MAGEYLNRIGMGAGAGMGGGHWSEDPEYQHRRRREQDREDDFKNSSEMGYLDQQPNEGAVEKPKSRGQVMVERLLSNAGGRKLSSDTNGVEYKGGKFKGMNLAQATQSAIDMVRSGEYDGTSGENGADSKARALQARLNGRSVRPGGGRPAAAARANRATSFYRTPTTAKDRENNLARAKQMREYYGGTDRKPGDGEGEVLVYGTNGQLTTGSVFNVPKGVGGVEKDSSMYVQSAMQDDEFRNRQNSNHEKRIKISDAGGDSRSVKSAVPNRYDADNLALAGERGKVDKWSTDDDGDDWLQKNVVLPAERRGYESNRQGKKFISRLLRATETPSR